MGAHHDHGHHHHHHGGGSLKSAFFLNLIFTLIEIVGGIMTNSMAILSDALHDLGDSLSLGVSWYLEKVSKKKRDEKYTYGYGRFSLLGAFINSVVLIVGSVVILMHAVPRLLDPQQPDVQGMILLSVLGIIFNGAAVLRLKGGSSLNEKVVRLHLLEDVLGWVAVLVVSIVMLFWEAPFLDPLMSIMITLYILYNVLKNFRQTVKIFMQAKPEDIDLDKLEKSLVKMKNIQSVHDMHLWTTDGQYYVMTVHVVVTQEVRMEEALELKREIRELTKEKGIEHATIELEYESESCELKKC
jgi:cobalt-zinc-cadmium efflux system protein